MAFCSTSKKIAKLAILCLTRIARCGKVGGIR
jgi:hypothetical protein